MGWSSPVIVAAFVLSVLAAPAFIIVERRVAGPMLPLDLFRSRQFSGTNAVTFVVYGALGGALFLLPVELQLVQHYTPLDSGLALLPVTVIMLLFSARSGQLSARIGPRLQMSLGPVLVGAGLALLARATDSGSYWTQVFPAVLLFGAGLAFTVAPLTATAMGSAPAEHSGIASAVNNTVAPRGRPVRSGRASAGGGTDGGGRAGAVRVGGGIPHRGVHLGRSLRRRRPAGAAHDPQPGPQAGTRRRTRVPPLLRGQRPARCAPPLVATAGPTES